MSLFHLFHLFIDWSELVGVACLLVGVVGLCFSLFSHVADQSLRSSCLPMTTLAQLHDCHSCNDERSIDQKKLDHTLARKNDSPTWCGVIVVVWCYCGGVVLLW